MAKNLVNSEDININVSGDDLSLVLPDSTKQKLTDSGWIDAEFTENFDIYSSTMKTQYRKIGNMVEISGAVKPTTQLAAGSGNKIIFYLPEEYRPKQNRYMVCHGSGSNKWLLTINASNGAVGASRYGTTEYIDIPTTAWLPFNITYFID